MLHLFVLVAAAAPSNDALAQSDCCGCLCVDAKWSCSSDTCTDAQGAVRKLAPEAGFFELDPGFIGPSATGRARMFYAFQPADSTPEDKPLLLFFQGGPFGSMVALWGGNTAPKTLDPVRTGGAQVASNPSSWSRFANLLYVDSPLCGFSYIAGGDDPTGGNDAALSWAEAAAFTQVLVDFLRHHPQIAQNRVVLVGESYGGTRAVLMLSQLLHYRELAGQRTAFDGAKLASGIEAHLAKALGPAPASGFTPAEVGTQFADVLIEPALGAWQTTPTAAARATERDTDQRFAKMTSALLQPAVFSQLTGVNAASIAWMRADARRAQQRFREADASFPRPDESAFAAVFGPLSQKPYFRMLVYYGVGRWRDTSRGFSDTLRYVPSLMTNAGADHVVGTNRIANELGALPGVKSSARRRVDAHLEQVAVTFDDGATRTLQLPGYPNSGHSISLFAPDQLAGDVQQWLGSLQD